MLFRITYLQLANFADNLATCLSAGIGIKQAVRTGTNSITRRVPQFAAVIQQVEAGDPLSDALEAVQSYLPSFVIPLVRCGEETGRLDETLRYLADHCRQLQRPHEALRNLWLFPLAAFATGQLLGGLIHVWLGSWSGVLASFGELIGTAGSVSAIAVLLLFTPLKALVDRVKLLLPVLSSAERELAASRFLHAFSLLYGVGGQRVERMVTQASQAVTNEWLREDLTRMARRIELGSPLADAFAGSRLFTLDEQSELAMGDLAGKLAETAHRIAIRSGESAVARLHVISRVVNRLTMGLVAFALLGALQTAIVQATWSSLPFRLE